MDPTRNHDDLWETQSWGAATLSEDGRYAEFTSRLPDLVPNDHNESFDVFVLERQTGTITRVSVASDGTEANGHSIIGKISGDGRYVAFKSSVSNLGPGDSNGIADVFVHDRQTGATIPIFIPGRSSSAEIRDAGAISRDGRYVGLSRGNDDTDQTVLSVRYIMIPTVTDVTPATVTRGTGQQVIINGSGFHPNADRHVWLRNHRHGRAGPGREPRPRRHHRRRRRVAGTRNVQVTNVGSFGPTSGSTNLCLGCFTIT